MFRAWGCVRRACTCALAAGNTPHNPVRFADTVGIVIERVRPEAAIGKYEHGTPDDLCVSSTSSRGHCRCVVLTKETFGIDRLRWYCRAPVHEVPTIIREESFHVTDLGTQLKPLIERWMTDEESRRCRACGTIAAAK
jgi:3-hydroxyanthranilate 3,4-dioxygenase